MPTRVQQLQRRMLAAADEVSKRMHAEFERLKVEDPQRAMENTFGFANGAGKLGPEGSPCPSARMKYAVDADTYITRFLLFAPYFVGLKSVYELGVGPGYMFLMLKDLLGVDIRGCDVNLKGERVYAELRRELGIDHLVVEHAVTSGRDIPIPEGTEAVAAFYTVFNLRWTVADHEWFLGECRRKLSGPRLVICRFNPEGFANNPEVAAFYRARGDFPLSKDDAFCVIDA